MRSKVALGQILAQRKNVREGFGGVIGKPLPLRQFVNPQPFEEQKVQVAPRQQACIHGVIAPGLAAEAEPSCRATARQRWSLIGTGWRTGAARADRVRLAHNAIEKGRGYLRPRRIPLIAVQVVAEGGERRN